VPNQESAQKPNEISALHPELGLRDVPGKSVQGRRQPERFGGAIFLATIQDPAGPEIVGITRPPALLLLPATGGLTVRIGASSLTGSHSRMGTKPTTANTAWSFSGIWHGRHHHHTREPKETVWLLRRRSPGCGRRPGTRRVPSCLEENRNSARRLTEIPETTRSQKRSRDGLWAPQKQVGGPLVASELW